MSTPPQALTAHDVRFSPTITALRNRVREESGKLLDDLERLHEAIDQMRPLVHTVEAFEMLEEMDTQTFEALDVLGRLFARPGILAAEDVRTEAEPA